MSSSLEPEELSQQRQLAARISARIGPEPIDIQEIVVITPESRQRLQKDRPLLIAAVDRANEWFAAHPGVGIYLWDVEEE